LQPRRMSEIRTLRHYDQREAPEFVCLFYDLNRRSGLRETLGLEARSWTGAR